MFRRASIVSFLTGLLVCGPAGAAAAFVPDDPFTDFSDPGPGDMSGLFGLFFVLAVVFGIGGAIWRVTTARKMAEKSGLDPDDAATMALMTDDARADSG